MEVCFMLSWVEDVIDIALISSFQDGGLFYVELE